MTSCCLLFYPIKQQFADGLDLTEAIRDLDMYTAALHGDFSPADRKSKARNSLQSYLQYPSNPIALVFVCGTTL